MVNTQLLKYIKSILHDDYAMSVLYYCMRRTIADNDYSLSGITTFRISSQYHKVSVSININHRFNGRLDALSLILSVRALMLNRTYIDCCDDDHLLFSSYIEHKYRWIEYYNIINECVCNDKDFANTFNMFNNAYENDEDDISGEEDDMFEEFTIQPERKNLKEYYFHKGSKEIGVTSQMICDNAFLCDDSIVEYTVPKSVEYIGNTAFAYCNSLTKLQFRRNNIIFGKFPIVECNNLKEIVVPNGSIEYYANTLPYYIDILVEEGSEFSSCNNGYYETESKGTHKLSLLKDKIVSCMRNYRTSHSVIENQKIIESAKQLQSDIDANVLEEPSYEVSLTSKEKAHDEDRKRLLMSSFEKKVTTYKYFWILSILSLIKDNGCNESIEMESAVKNMLVQAWRYVIEKESIFPSSDQIIDIIKIMWDNTEYGYTNDSDILFIINEELKKDVKLKKKVMNLANNAPYRFLSPWITFTSTSDVVAKSKNYENDCPYSVDKSEICINKNWSSFLIDNNDTLVRHISDDLCKYLKISPDDFEIEADDIKEADIEPKEKE